MPKRTTSSLSMRGLLIRKVRSTPIPLAEMRRMVKFSLIPADRRRMTTPSNAWRRSRVPSTTRIIARTVSPARKSGIPSRSCSFSMLRMISTIGRPYSSGQRCARTQMPRWCGEMPTQIFPHGGGRVGGEYSRGAGGAATVVGRKAQGIGRKGIDRAAVALLQATCFVQSPYALRPTPNPADSGVPLRYAALGIRLSAPY